MLLLLAIGGGGFCLITLQESDSEAQLIELWETVIARPLHNTLQRQGSATSGTRRQGAPSVLLANDGQCQCCCWNPRAGVGSKGDVAVT